MSDVELTVIVHNPDSDKPLIWTQKVAPGSFWEEQFPDGMQVRSVRVSVPKVPDE